MRFTNEEQESELSWLPREEFQNFCDVEQDELGLTAWNVKSVFS